MWGRAMGGPPLLLLLPLLPLLLLLLLPGAAALSCLSCGGGAESCREPELVTCPPGSDVCAEAWAGLSWSHGQVTLGGRGCGRGQPGEQGRALELLGLVTFERRSQCREGRGCNQRLPMGSQESLTPPGNASERSPNGLRCYGCPGDGPCPPGAVVQCYGPLRGCFHGNLTLSLGGSTVWREVRGCVTTPSCPGAWRGDEVVGLGGTCCGGDLCNGRPEEGGAFFAPDWPRLQRLPHGHAPAVNGSAEGLNGTSKMADGEAKVAATVADVANGVNGSIDMAASGPETTTVDPKKTTVGTKKTMIDPNMAAVDPTTTVDHKMAAVDPTMATVGPKMAAGDKMATTGPKKTMVDPKMVDADPNMADTDPKMADADPNMAAGRPRERKGGTKGPVGRGQQWAGPGWLLPLLLLPLL